MSDQQDIVKFENVSTRYGRGPKILKNVSFCLPKGSFHFLTGASGAGKSSLIKLLYLGHWNFEGRITICEKNIKALQEKELPALRQDIGVVFQDFQLLDHISVVDNVALPLRVRGMAVKQAQTHASEILNWVGLKGYDKTFPDVLSGGEQQRVALARAVIGRPKLLLADEPTGSVDDKTAVKLLYLFEELNKMGTTIVLATHNRDLAGGFPYPEIHVENKTLRILKASEDNIENMVRYA